jgi:hypothetical protein
MRTLTGLILLALAVSLLVAELFALVDPTLGLELDAPASTFVATAPWYVHAAWFAAAAALGWAAARLLNRGILGRLVRGRGFTPAER